MPRKDIFSLIDKVGKAEKELISGDIFASVAPNSRLIRTSVSGMVREFNIPKQKTAGLRIFHATSTSIAKYVRDADAVEARQYLDLLPKVNFVLVYRDDLYWYGFPANLESYTTRIGDPALVRVHNADNVEVFDHVISRYDGACFWFDDLDFRVDPERVLNMRQALQGRDWAKISTVAVDDVRTYALDIKGLTPEDAIAYQLVARRLIQETRSTLESRLESELKNVEAKLDSYVERGDNVEVRWVNASGQPYTSVIRKDDFQVVTAGICVSGEDRKFDLKSLVGVVTNAEKKRGVVRIGDGYMEEGHYFNVHPEPKDLGNRGRR